MSVFQNIFIVDDDPLQVELLRHHFSKRGCGTVHAAPDGKIALQDLKDLAVKPDLIVCDLYMPNVDGIECAMSIKDICGDNTAILFISGSGQQQMTAASHLANGFGLKCLGALSKPLNFDEIDRLVFPSFARETAKL